MKTRKTPRLKTGCRAGRDYELVPGKIEMPG
jgi:hypothetical protein